MKCRKTLRFLPIFLTIALIFTMGIAWGENAVAPISIYDKDDLVKISLEDIGKYHGDVCACVAIGFRSLQTAIDKLWGNKIPNRGDFKIITAHPGKGSQDCFEFITRVKTRKKGKDFMFKMPQGTDRATLTKENFVFTFFRKSTGEKVKLSVKENIFPENFFMLRKKVKFEGTATPEEKKMFKSGIKKFKRKFMTLQADELFEIEKG